MSDAGLILPITIGIIVFLLCMIVFFFTNKEGSTRERLRRMVNSTAPTELQKQEEAKEEPPAEPLRSDQDLSGPAIFCDQILRLMGIDTNSFRKTSQLRFYRAGLNSPDAPIYFLFFKRIGFVSLLIAAFWIFTITASGSTWLLYKLIAFILAVLAIWGPEMLIRNMQEKRQKILLRSFPDALDLLLVCVDSGLALDGALARVCKELRRARPEIAQELNRTRMELTLLNDRTQALNNLSERTDMIAFRSLVATLLQSERFGTSLTDTLRVLSEDYRNSRLMLAEEKAGRLPAIITIPLIAFLVPALFLIILGPAILQVMHLMR